MITDCGLQGRGAKRSIITFLGAGGSLLPILDIRILVSWLNLWLHNYIYGDQWAYKSYWWLESPFNHFLCKRVVKQLQRVHLLSFQRLDSLWPFSILILFFWWGNSFAYDNSKHTPFHTKKSKFKQTRLRRGHRKSFL